jgi:hypothetical protein
VVGDGRGGWQDRTVEMRVPPMVNRDGTPRSLIAQQPYPFIGTGFSEGMQERITTGREIKAMRAADTAAQA